MIPDAPPMPIPEGARTILQTLRDNGCESHLAGGCVRDWLMGRAPKDFDIATAATPERIESLFPRTIPVGKAFGVMCVVMPDGHYEVATFRSDGAYTDGRRPEGVVFSTAEEDVRRRDFTINALLYDPFTNTVIDHVGGLADLEARCLRTVGDPETRFREDHLRLLRGVRFAARTGFRIEDATLAATRALAGLVRTVSAERVGTELTLMLQGGYAARAFACLEETSLLVHVLPELAPMKGMPQPLEFHPEGDVWEHTLLMLKGLDTLDPPCGTLTEAERALLGWAALLHDVAKPITLSVSDRIRFHEHDIRGAEMAVDILRRLKRSKRLCDAVQALISMHIKFSSIAKMRVPKRRRLLQDPLFPLHLSLHYLDCMASHRMLDPYRFALEAWREEQARPPEVEPVLTGKELLALGYEAGPGIGRILGAVSDLQLEGVLTTKADATAWVLAHHPLPKL